MLSIAATPIGNLKDLSYRFVETVSSCDIVAVESTQAFGTLKQYIRDTIGASFPSEQRVVHVDKDNEYEKVYSIKQSLEEGKTVMYLSEAGTPLVSDPGYLLVHEAIKSGIRIEVLPGSSAPVTALLLSGFHTKQWMFIGFLPKKPGDIKRKIQEMKAFKEVDKDLVIIFFESPHRIKKTLGLLSEHYPEALLSVSREMTKKFEETRRGTSEELMKHEYKGEITVCLQ